MIHSSPRRQIIRQQLPGTSTADCVEDAVQDFPSAVYGRASARFHHRDERLQMFPFRVAQVSVVRGPAGHRCSSAYGTDPFQTRSQFDFIHSRCITNGMAEAREQCVRDFHYVEFGMGCEEIGRMPELLAYRCNGIGEGGLCLGIPGSLANRELTVASQTVCQ